MKAIVAKPFRCKYSHTRYLRGQAYEHEDPARIKELTEAGYLEDAPLLVSDPDDSPEIQVEPEPETAVEFETVVAEMNALQLMTKKELETELKKRGIAYNTRQSKAELFTMLTNQ